MSWHTVENSPRFYRIARGEGPTEEFIGSITCTEAGRWVVEIVLPPHDIMTEFSEYRTALAFVEGVEKTMSIMEKLDGCRVR